MTIDLMGNFPEPAAIQTKAGKPLMEVVSSSYPMNALVNCRARGIYDLQWAGGCVLSRAMTQEPDYRSDSVPYSPVDWERDEDLDAGHLQSSGGLWGFFNFGYKNLLPPPFLSNRAFTSSIPPELTPPAKPKSYSREGSRHSQCS